MNEINSNILINRKWTSIEWKVLKQRLWLWHEWEMAGVVRLNPFITKDIRIINFGYLDNGFSISE